MKYLLSNISDATYTEVGGRYTYKSSRQTAELCKRYGLGMELSELSLVGNLEQNRQQTLADFHYNAQAAQKLGLAVHAPFSELYCHAMDQRLVELAQASWHEAYGLSCQIGASVMVVHTNHIASIYHPDWVVEHHVAFWKEFLHKHPGGTSIALENTIDETPELLWRIAQGVGDPRLGICLDVGHANLSPIPVEEWMRTLAPHLIHYHLHNNSGVRAGTLWFLSDSHSALGKGSLDMAKVLLLANRLTPSATATLETSALEQSIQWLSENHFISL